MRPRQAAALSVSALLGLQLAVGCHGQCLVVGNSGFEDTDTTSVTIGINHGPIPRWQSSPNTVAVGVNGDNYFGGLSTGTGRNFAVLEGYGAYISQQVQGFEPGFRYQLTFVAAERPGVGANEILEVYAGGGTVASIELTHSGLGFLNYSVTFVANCTTCEIKFRNVSPAAGSTLNVVMLDSVSLCGLCLSLSNPNFDAGPATPNWTYTTPTSWTSQGRVAVVANTATEWGPGSATLDGPYYVALQGPTSAVGQTLSGLRVGSKYTVNFLSGTRVGLCVSQGSVVARLDGSDLVGGEFNPTETFTGYSLTFRAWKPTAVLEFVNVSPVLLGSLCTIFIDRISVCNSDVVVGNADFDDDAVSTAASAVVPSGWALSGSVYLARNGALEWGGLNSTSGENFAVLEAARSGVAQVVRDMTIGKKYAVTFQAGQPPMSPDGGQLVISIGTREWVLSQATLPEGAFAPFALTYTASAPFATLSFNNSSPAVSNGTVLMDDVAVFDMCLVVHNAGFELNDHGLTSSLIQPAGWVTHGRVFTAANGLSPWSRLHSGEGTFYAVLDGDSTSLSQALVGFATGKRYMLSLLTARPLGNSSSLEVTLSSNSTAVATWTVVPSATQFTRYSYALDAFEGLSLTTLMLRNAGSSGSVFVDAVVLCDTCVFVHNADFEENANLRTMTHATPNGWTSNNNVLIGLSSSFAGGTSASSEGTYFVALRGGSISQTLFGLAPNRTYRVSWVSAVVHHGSTAEGELTATVDGQDLLRAIPSAASFEPMQFTVATLGTRATLTFSSTGSSDVLLDSVAVCDVCVVVNNAGFEDDSVTAGRLRLIPNAWASSGTVFVQRQQGSATGTLNSDDGNVFAVLAGSSALSQVLNGLTTGTDYVISFRAAADPGNTGSLLRVEVDGTALGSPTTLSPGFERFEFSFRATGTSATLSLANAASNVQSALFLDSILVCPSANTLLPAPTASAMSSCNGVSDPIFCRSVTDCDDVNQAGAHCPGLCTQYCLTSTPPTATMTASSADSSDETRTMIIVIGIVVVVAVVSIAMVRRRNSRRTLKPQPPQSPFTVEAVVDNPKFQQDQLEILQMAAEANRPRTESQRSSFTIEPVIDNPRMTAETSFAYPTSAAVVDRPRSGSSQSGFTIEPVVDNPRTKSRSGSTNSGFTIEPVVDNPRHSPRTARARSGSNPRTKSRSGSTNSGFTIEPVVDNPRHSPRTSRARSGSSHSGFTIEPVIDNPRSSKPPPAYPPHPSYDDDLEGLPIGSVDDRAYHRASYVDIAGEEEDIPGEYDGFE